MITEDEIELMEIVAEKVEEQKDEFITNTIVRNHAVNFDDNPKNLLDYCILTVSMSEPLKNNIGLLIQDINDENNEYFKYWDKEEIKKVSLLLNQIRKDK